MRWRGVPILLFASCLASGCLVVSLQPVYDTESVVFDEALLGRWENRDDGAKVSIERAEWRSYKIAYTDRFATRSFQGNITKIGPARYLDLTEMRGADPGPYLVPVHGLWRITVEGAAVSAVPLDYTWFTRAMLQKSLNRLALAVDDRRNVVIAAPTGELRRWLAHPPDEAFATPMNFTKVK